MTMTTTIDVSINNYNFVIIIIVLKKSLKHNSRISSCTFFSSSFSLLGFLFDALIAFSGVNFWQELANLKIYLQQLGSREDMGHSKEFHWEYKSFRLLS